MAENIRDKIKKLFAIARDKGATEAEATSAMKKATELMIKYNLEVDPDSEEVTVKRGDWFLREFGQQWHRRLSSAAAILYNCRNVVAMGGGGVYFVGRPENIDAAQQTYEFLIQQVEALYKINLPRGLSQAVRADFRKNFKYACSCRVELRARELMEMYKDNEYALQNTGCTSLVVVQNMLVQLKEADDFLLGLKTKKTKSSQPKIGIGTAAGLIAGNAVELRNNVRDNKILAITKQ